MEERHADRICSQLSGINTAIGMVFVVLCVMCGMMIFGGPMKVQIVTPTTTAHQEHK